MKCQCPSTKLHVVTFLNAVIFTCKVGLTNEPQKTGCPFHRPEDRERTSLPQPSDMD
jgi:hypothetical protein